MIEITAKRKKLEKLTKISYSFICETVLKVLFLINV